MPQRFNDACFPHEGQLCFQLDRPVKVVLDASLAAMSDKNNLFNASSLRFVDCIGSEAVDDRQHFLGYRFRGGRKRVPSPATGKTAFRTTFVDLRLDDAVLSESTSFRFATTECSGNAHK